MYNINESSFDVLINLSIYEYVRRSEGLLMFPDPNCISAMLYTYSGMENSPITMTVASGRRKGASLALRLGLLGGEVGLADDALY